MYEADKQRLLDSLTKAYAKPSQEKFLETQIYLGGGNYSPLTLVINGFVGFHDYSRYISGQTLFDWLWHNQITAGDYKRTPEFILLVAMEHPEIFESKYEWLALCEVKSLGWKWVRHRAELLVYRKGQLGTGLEPKTLTVAEVRARLDQSVGMTLQDFYQLDLTSQQNLFWACMGHAS